jgi:hypothetical protein
MGRPYYFFLFRQSREQATNPAGTLHKRFKRVDYVSIRSSIFARLLPDNLLKMSSGLKTGTLVDWFLYTLC